MLRSCRNSHNLNILPPHSRGFWGLGCDPKSSTLTTWLHRDSCSLSVLPLYRAVTIWRQCTDFLKLRRQLVCQTGEEFNAWRNMPLFLRLIATMCIAYFVVRGVFTWVSKVNHGGLLRLSISFKNSRYTFSTNQKLNQDQSWVARARFLSLCTGYMYFRLVVIGSLDCLCPQVFTGQSDFFYIYLSVKTVLSRYKQYRRGLYKANIVLSTWETFLTHFQRVVPMNVSIACWSHGGHDPVNCGAITSQGRRIKEIYNERIDIIF